MGRNFDIISGVTRVCQLSDESVGAILIRFESIKRDKTKDFKRKQDGEKHNR